MQELERFMADTLCQQERLDISQVKIHRSWMRKGNNLVGIVVRVDGPRLMRSQAIWSEQENRVLFYDSAGHRFAIVKLAEAPELLQSAA